jgi:DNA-binding IscR family transcriptional regulator
LSSQPTQQKQLDDAVKALKCSKIGDSTCRGRNCFVKESMRSTKGRILEAEDLETKAQQLEEYAELIMSNQGIQNDYFI